MVRLVYLGYAAPLAGPVPPRQPALDERGAAAAWSARVARARATARGRWLQVVADGALLDPAGKRVEFSIVTSSGNADRVQMATLIQDDLKALGMHVHVVPLEFRSLLDRVLQTQDYEACLLSLASADADPNPDMAVWLSSGGNAPVESGAEDARHPVGSGDRRV